MLRFKQFIIEKQFPMIDVDGTLKHKTNSEGKLIHPTEDGIRNFYRWFGNSKTVDEHGRPLVMYRGMNSPHQDDHNTQKPTWVTPHVEYANRYADGNNANVSKLYVKSESPVNLGFRSQLTHVKFKDISRRIRDRILEKLNNKELSEIEAKSAIEHLRNGENVHKDEMKPAFDFQDNSEHLHNALLASKYDSIQSKEGDSLLFGDNPANITYGILNKNNIKSAISNNGNFSSTSNKIQEQVNVKI